MTMLQRMTINGMEEVKGQIYKDLGIYKMNDTYYCILLNGGNKGNALCSCSKLKLIKEFINELLNISTVQNIENNNCDSSVFSEIKK